MTDFTTSTAFQTTKALQAPALTVAKNAVIVKTPSTLEILKAAQTDLVNAELAKDAAWKAFNDAIEMPYDSKTYRPAIEAAYEEAKELSNQASVLWHAVEAAKANHLAYIAAQEELEYMCDCNPAYTCPLCIDRAHNSEIIF